MPATTRRLSRTIWRISGDYAGQAQAEIEKQLPETTAMFLMLCGGDQNPNPRGQPEYVESTAGSISRRGGPRVAQEARAGVRTDDGGYNCGILR